MSEVNDTDVSVGQKILVGSQVAVLKMYEPGIDRMRYTMLDGNGTNDVECHISNTPFEVLNGSTDDHLGKLSDLLDAAEANVVEPFDPNYTPESEAPAKGK